MTYGTMEKIETVTLSSSQASIAFATLPTTYDDLLIKVSARSTTSDGSLYLSFNSSTANFSWRRLIGSGSAASSQSGTDNYSGSICRSTDTASTFGNAEIYIPNYRGSTNKSYTADTVLENNATEAFQMMVAGLWSQTAAITTVSLAAATSFAANTTATLYGITRVPAGAKATGGVITDTDTHWIHTFTSSGTFTPSQNLTCDYLVVAGGGGGGRYYGGGGGAGGYRTTVGTSGRNSSAETPLSLTANTSYTVTIGGGGAAGANQSPGTQGGNSVFSTITSTGGGFGNGSTGSGANGGTGGAGGGAGGFSVGTGGAGTSNQGFDGGGVPSGASGAGGGGAGAAGNNNNAGTNPGRGGNGLASSITGSSVTRAGGGGGSGPTTPPTGGDGGGGTAATELAPATGGTVNTGSGGGGGSNPQVAGAGGSGIVIVRYAK